LVISPISPRQQGGVAVLAGQCETVSAWHRGNDLPLLWPIHAKHRVLLFRLLDLVDVRTATQDHSLLDALGVVSKHRHARRDEVLEDVDLGFASQRWQSFVAKRRLKSGTFDRRALEVCVFVYLAEALQTGDLYVVGAENFADYPRSKRASLRLVSPSRYQADAAHARHQRPYLLSPSQIVPL
jgi:hypothetical protein